MPGDHIESAREHVDRARDLLQHAAEATHVQDLDDQLDSIDEALRTIDRWEDEPERRLDQIRTQLYEMETGPSLERELRRELRDARAEIRAYQAERFGPVERVDA